MNKLEKSTAIKWVKSFIAPEASMIITVMLISMVMTLFALAQPYLTKILIDDGLISQNMNVIIKFSLIMLLIAFITFLLTGLNRWLYIKLSGHILFKLREDVFRHLLTLNPYFYQRWRRGDILSRLDGDIATVQRFSTDILLTVINGALGFIGSIVIMLSLNWQLTLIAFLLLPLQILFLRFMRQRLENANRNLREKSADLGSFLIEKISSVKLIQSFTNNRTEEESLSHLNNSYLSNLLSLQMINHVAMGIPGLLSVMATTGIFIIGGYFVTTGQTTVGTLIAFSAYMGRATGPIQNFLGLYVAYQKAMVSLVRVNELKNYKITIQEVQSPISLPLNVPKDIIFHGISYAHPSSQGLQDINLTVKEGTRILITGPSGSGKSTLMDLIHRHFDPQKGSITYAGVDIRQLSLKSLRSNIAVIDQNSLFFKGSIWDNLTYGLQNVSKAQVDEAVKTAQIYDFIQAQKDGYATEIGDNATALSGGEKQRLSIARALIQKPNLLILDESTSALDHQNELEIHRLLTENFKNITLIIISHHVRGTHAPDHTYHLQDGILSEVKS